MSRKEIYEKLEAIEGGEAIRDQLKALFQADDTKLQETVDALKTAKGDYAKQGEELEGLKAASADTVPKTEMEKTISEMQKTLNAITEERDEARKASEAAEVERRNGELSKHFISAVIDGFGAKNAEMAVGYGMSNGSIKYDDENNMSYNGKIGDEAIELFRADNSHLIQNKGTSTTGGNHSNSTDSYMAELREQMLRD